MKKLLKGDKNLFLKIHGFVADRDKLKGVIKIVNGLSSKLYTAVYLLYIGMMVLRRDSRLFGLIVVPATSFLIVTYLRKKLNRRRPYLALGVDSVLDHGEVGSLPSRHASSAMVIAISIYSLDPMVGAVLICLALVTGSFRVLAGVHYPLDVLVGFGVAILIYTIFQIVQGAVL